MAASPALSRLLLIPAGGRDPQQMVDVRLDGQGLPHIPLGRVLLGIEGSFLLLQLFSGQYLGKTGIWHGKRPATPEQVSRSLKISWVPGA